MDPVFSFIFYTAQQQECTKSFVATEQSRRSALLACKHLAAPLRYAPRRFAPLRL